MGIDYSERWPSILVKFCQNYILRNSIPYECKNNQEIKLGTQGLRCSDIKVTVFI